MIRTLVIAAVLASSAPVSMAQVAYAPAEAPAAPAASSDAEFETVANAFGARMEAMQQEMATVINNTPGDPTRRDADLDAIEARYQPEVDAFAVAMEAFANSQVALLPEAQQEQMRAQIAVALPQIRALTLQIRTGLEQAAAQAAAGS